MLSATRLFLIDMLPPNFNLWHVPARRAAAYTTSEPILERAAPRPITRLAGRPGAVYSVRSVACQVIGEKRRVGWIEHRQRPSSGYTSAPDCSGDPENRLARLMKKHKTV
jgi:hypothetical protein